MSTGWFNYLRVEPWELKIPHSLLNAESHFVNLVKGVKN
jgi:hypothetical protein